jgi:hypothetical protein
MADKAVKLRAPFDRFPHPYAYSLLLDAMDILGFLPIVGEAIDIVQTLLALAIYENVSIALIGGAAELLLPFIPDFLPSFTIRVFLAKRGLLN